MSLVTDAIDRIEATGIRTVDGKLHEVDAIVCATGFDVSHRPPWPLIGRHGITLAEAWKDEPTGYLSLAASGFPNFLYVLEVASSMSHALMTIACSPAQTRQQGMDH